jgi:hypothetical protein
VGYVFGGLVKYIIIALLILILSPLVVKLYISVAPGDMIGTIDGWLSFAGGYTGGLLAFISALYIFQSQRKETIKPFLDVKAIEKNTSSILYDLVSPSPEFIQAETCKTVGLNRDDLVLTIYIKNIGLGPCLKLNLLNENKKKLFHYFRYEKRFLSNQSLATVEVGKGVTCAICIDLNKANAGEYFTAKYILEYSDIYGNSHKQKIEIHKMSEDSYGISV